MAAGRLALGDLVFAGQELDGAVQAPGFLQVAHEARLLLQQVLAQALGDGQHLGLEGVVAQYQLADLIGHLRQQAVALLLGHLAVGQGQAEQDLDVDLVVRGVHAGRVVDRVGVESHTRLRGLDAAQLREAEVATLADDLAAQLAAVDAQGVVGAVAHLGMAFAAGLHIGADAAVVEQVHGCLQQCVHQLQRRQALGVNAQPFTHLG